MGELSVSRIYKNSANTEEYYNRGESYSVQKSLSLLISIEDDYILYISRYPYLYEFDHVITPLQY